MDNQHLRKQQVCGNSMSKRVCTRCGDAPQKANSLSTLSTLVLKKHRWSSLLHASAPLCLVYVSNKLPVHGTSRTVQASHKVSNNTAGATQCLPRSSRGVPEVGRRRLIWLERSLVP